MKNFLNKEELVVPTADSAADAYMMDVIGKKADTVAGDSLVAVAKQNAAAVVVVDGLHDVPVADADTNLYMRDVVGIKTDAAVAGPVTATDSLMGYAKTLVNGAQQVVATASLALPQGGPGTLALFTVTGAVNIIEIRGFIDVQIGAVANATKLTAGAGSVDICATVELNAAAANSVLSITGTFANPLIISAGGAWEAQPNKVGAGAGSISVSCAGTSGTGEVTWVCIWEPILGGGTVVAA